MKKKIADTAEKIVDIAGMDVPVVKEYDMAESNAEVIEIEKLKRSEVNRAKTANNLTLLDDVTVKDVETPEVCSVICTTPPTLIKLNDSKPGTPSTPAPGMRQRGKLLVSNILTAEEIVKEVVERSEKNRSHKLPEGGDLIFQRQLTRRLAKRLIKEGSLNHDLSSEMFTPTSDPPLSPLVNHQPDANAQMLLQILILKEDAESRPKVSKIIKTDNDFDFGKEIALKQLMEVSQKRKPRESNNNLKSDPKPRKRLKSEVQKLLKDNGTISVLYAKERREEGVKTKQKLENSVEKAPAAKQNLNTLFDSKDLCSEPTVKTIPEVPLDQNVFKEKLQTNFTSKLKTMFLHGGWNSKGDIKEVNSVVSLKNKIASLTASDPGDVVCTCGRRYKHRFTLKRHQMYECGQEHRFKCSYCKFMSKRKSSLKRHLIMIHCVASTDDISGFQTSNRRLR